MVEIFWGVAGPDRALEMAEQRRGRWFDPELVDCLQAISSPSLWASLETTDLIATVAAAEPAERAIEATDERLDQIATAFAWVIDAKSSFTFEHSDRVSSLALGAAAQLGFSPAQLTRLRRAALLHDIGKLAVPNAILDKPGKLTDAEWEVVKQHPAHTLHVLQQVPVFRELAEDAANHHERIDGRGYFRGLTRRGPDADGAAAGGGRCHRRADERAPVSRGHAGRDGDCTPTSRAAARSSAPTAWTLWRRRLEKGCLICAMRRTLSLALVAPASSSVRPVLHGQMAHRLKGSIRTDAGVAARGRDGPRRQPDRLSRRAVRRRRKSTSTTSLAER